MIEDGFYFVEKGNHRILNSPEDQSGIWFVKNTIGGCVLQQPNTNMGLSCDKHNNVVLGNVNDCSMHISDGKIYDKNKRLFLNIDGNKLIWTRHPVSWNFLKVSLTKPKTMRIYVRMCILLVLSFVFLLLLMRNNNSTSHIDPWQFGRLKSAN